ncbi:hypothetical protein [Ruegeria arenilitoris]|uniref:hypothetical protein n=1 Tax=Ruegeria arenilitoris TaxID=1173585 RepID=UPI00147D6D89|nr:hypothetical protein [Ruegeria arenilitoris]
MITNAEIGGNGRFGNQIFQYMFLSFHAAKYGLEFANPPWDGDVIFKIQPGRNSLPEQDRKLVEDIKDPQHCPIRNATGPLDGVDVSGYFQYTTSFYSPQRDRLCGEFSFKPPYSDFAKRLQGWFSELPGTVVAVHMRRGDYGTGIFFRAPSEWYTAWLATLQKRVGELTVYVASDELDEVLGGFDAFKTVSAKDAPHPLPSPEFVTDFMALCVAPHVAISNSSMSFAATMFNAVATSFYRPSLKERRLIEYDPWDAEVLLTDVIAEDAGEEFMSERAKSRTKYKIRKFFRRNAWQHQRTNRT